SKPTYEELEKRIEELESTEEALRLSEEKFSKAFYGSPDSITISSLINGRLIEINEGFESLSGFSRDEAIGKTTTELGLWTDQKDRKAVIEILTKEQKIRNFYTEGHTKSERVFKCELSMELIDFGGEKCLLTITKDVSEDLQFRTDSC
ncbi:PAS domain S-box protein, partial [candidate division KSB1 bacterium]